MPFADDGDRVRDHQRIFEVRGKDYNSLTVFLHGGNDPADRIAPVLIDVVERLMDKNLRTDGCSGLEDFKRKHRIKNMNFIGSNVMEKGDNIYMMVNYDVEVVKLLHIEKVFHFSHGAYAEIW